MWKWILPSTKSCAVYPHILWCGQHRFWRRHCRWKTYTSWNNDGGITSNPDLQQDRQQSPGVTYKTQTVAAKLSTKVEGICHTSYQSKVQGLLLQFLSVDHEYRKMDTVWLTNRCIARCLETVLNQPIPLWAGYNVLVTLDERPITMLHTFPLLKSPAHEYNILIDVLKQAQQITASVRGQNSKVVITLTWIFTFELWSCSLCDLLCTTAMCFGLVSFTLLCSLRAIGSFIENSGIDDAWVQSDIYSSATCRQILEGKHMKKALDAHVTTMQVLFNLTLELFSVDYTSVYQQLQSLCSELLNDGMDSRFHTQADFIMQCRHSWGQVYSRCIRKMHRVCSDSSHHILNYFRHLSTSLEHPGMDCGCFICPVLRSSVVFSLARIVWSMRIMYQSILPRCRNLRKLLHLSGKNLCKVTSAWRAL